MNITAACAVLKQFTISDGATASDTRLAHCVYSIAAALGAPGSPAEEFREAIAEATSGEFNMETQVTKTKDGGFYVAAGNPYGMTEGVYYIKKENILVADYPDVPDAEDLKTMTKPMLIAQAAKEGLNLGVAKNNEERIAAILAARKQE
jgi:hypothetical protein